MHKNPGEADLIRELGKIRAITAKESASDPARAPSKGTGQSEGVDLSTHHRQKEMLSRENKRKALVAFVEDNDLSYEDVLVVLMKFGAASRVKELQNMCDFDLFCEIFKVDPITEYKVLFQLFDTEEKRKIDIREFLLSLLNFVEVSKEDRVKFSFDLYDEKRTNFITLNEIESILQGNHMMSRTAIAKKAETIMKQTQANSKGMITLAEFQATSSKFPNILFPMFVSPKQTVKNKEVATNFVAPRKALLSH